MNTKALFLLLTISLLWMPVPSVAQAFGKIFSTPQERQYLDRLRKELFAELSEAERVRALQTPNSIIPNIEAPPTIIYMGDHIQFG